MSEFRLGDVIDDHCIKCRRITNHSIVSLVKAAPAKVRCRTCYNDHDYRHEQAPPSKKDLKKQELFNEVLSSVATGSPDSAVAAEDPETQPDPPKKKARTKKSVSTTWDAEQYEGRHSYVWRLGAGVVELLAPRAGERILDIGCGTGQLTSEIAKLGAQVVGLDSSTNMIGQARQNYPGLTFTLANATSFRFDEPFDAVFSNAALHWVKDADAAVESIGLALQPGGRFVAEFGGRGNTRAIMAALRTVLGDESDNRSPWYYPSISEYSSLLERRGLEVRHAQLFDRPTPVEGENGMHDWLQMFCGNFFKDLSAEQLRESMQEIVDLLRPKLYRDGVWTIDYRRLRVVAVKPTFS